MFPVLAIQLALPVILITWIAIVPPRAALVFWIQAIAIAVVLMTIGLSGLWTFLPWWTPYVYGGLLFAAIGRALFQRQPFASVLPFGLYEWAVVALFLALGGVAIHQSTLALAGRTPPPGRLVDLAFPLSRGTYLVVNGGSKFSINTHVKTLDVGVPRYRAWRGQSYGVDIVKIDETGLRAHGVQPAEPQAYRIYGQPVLAPCAGEIVLVLDGLQDMRVPRTDRAHMAGNHVLLRCGGIDVLLGHFRPGSMQVAAGDHVEVGDRIAAVGNSGNSEEPHLHIHAQKIGTVDMPLSGEPLPMRFNRRFLVRNDRIAVR